MIKSDDTWEIEDYGIVIHTEGDMERKCREVRVLHKATGFASFVIVPEDVLSFMTIDGFIISHKGYILDAILRVPREEWPIYLRKKNDTTQPTIINAS